MIKKTVILLQKKQMISGLKALHSHLNYSRNVAIHGKSFKVPIIKNMGLLNLKLKGDWFGDVVKATEILPDHSFIDVGANVGQTLLQFKSLSSAKYTGFEPNPACVFYVQQLIGLNKIEKAELVPCGLSSSPGILKLYQKGPGDSAGTLISGLRPSFYSERDVTFVPVFVFDELALNREKKVVLVKIDVEGAELEVLQGMKNMLKKNQPTVICEILDAHSQESLGEMQQRADQLVELIKSLDYRIFRIRRHSGRTECEETASVKLKQWTVDSWDLNDYLFISKDNSPKVLQKLRDLK